MASERGISRPYARRYRVRVFVVVIATALVTLCGSPMAAEGDITEIRIAYLTQIAKQPPALSNLDEPIPDEGLQGSLLAIDDNNTSGRFLKQHFSLKLVRVEEDGDVAAALHALYADGYRIVVADLQAAALDRILATPIASQMMIFNARAPDDRFRNDDCRSFLLHTMPSRAMLADALAQYLVKKRWTDWFLVVGTRAEDELFAAAVRRAAKRFGGRIVEEKSWAFEHDLRRTAQAEVPVFTQVDAYDVLIVADEIGDFGEYLAYRTWDPRPVAGTQGLVPTAWHRTVEQWGAAQLQSRFRKQAGRWMTARDYAAWVAVRAVGEAAMRTGAGGLKTLSAYIHSDALQLSAFKGRKLSFRPWNGQLRQPIPVAAARSLVTLSPQEGFLHPTTELDTLGYDKPESTCRMVDR